MAKTKPNIVKVLIEKPKIDMMPKVPSNTTGMAMVGISVARKFCKNKYITKKTKMMASTNVLATFLIEILTKGVVS